MESEGKVTFEDWTYLQKCLKYEKLRLSHGNCNPDELEKKELLSKLEDLHRAYYEHQLKVRDFQEISDYKKRLIPDAHAFLGDSFRYVEAFILQIRTKPDIFAFVASSCRQRRDKIDGLVESFGFSFFLDLVHPENTELELLNAIHRILKEELVYLRDSGHVSNLLNENLVLRKMLILYMKRKNQRKYMKLVFKKSLREIIHDQERIKELILDPKQIYRAENEKIRVYQKEEPVPVKKKTGLFRRKVKEEKKEEVSPVMEVSEAEAMASPQVLELIEGRSQVIIDHCKSLLQSLYKNVRTMPYGLRGICKQTIALIDELVCGVSDAEKYSLLGNMLFTFWWIPAIIDPIKNGLLQNVMIHKVTLGYLKTIGTIFKNIFKESEFDEPQYFVINSFIKEESVHMKEFFRDIIYLEEGANLWRKSSIPLYPLPCTNVSEDQKNRGTMCNYYLTALTRPKISPFNFHSKTRKQAENMSEIKEFKVITSVLSIEDIKFLARIVKEQETAVTEKGWNDLLRYAKVISKADETDSLIQSSYTAEINLQQNEIPYLFFMKKNFGDIENSYIANLHKSQSNFPKTADFEGEKLLAKVKDATRNLLGCLDMSIFFDLSKEWSLKDIAEFVIQFSYLFENKKAAAQEGVPLKLLAQFLATYLKSVPEDYIAYNFRKLYTTLQKECEDRFETLRRAANKNKKLLLLAVNFMEKHVSDIKLEVKVQESLQRKAYFIQFIKDGRVPACLLTVKEGPYNTVQVYSQNICPHSKLQSVGDFVLGGRGSKSIKTESTHIFSIEEFYQRFMKLDQVVQSTENVEDYYNVGGAFFDYVALVRNVLKDAGLGEEDIETTTEEIEKHITSSMYHHIFPSKASIEDTNLHNKTLELDWVKPEHMDIDPSNRNEDMWKFAIESLEAIDDYRAPSEKLNCLADCMSIIVNVLSLVSSGSGGVGTDDSLPIIIYVVLKAKPKRLYSNLNYISKFRHHTKMIGLKGFVFQQFQSAASYIENIDHTSLNMDLDVYQRNVEESRSKVRAGRDRD